MQLPGSIFDAPAGARKVELGLRPENAVIVPPEEAQQTIAVDYVEPTGAGAVDVDALTTGNDDILIILVRGLGFAPKYSLRDRLLTSACLAWMMVSLVRWAQLGTTSGQ